MSSICSYVFLILICINTCEEKTFSICVLVVFQNITCVVHIKVIQYFHIMQVFSLVMNYDLILYFWIKYVSNFFHQFLLENFMKNYSINPIQLHIVEKNY